jgi:hypothetical protein
MRRRFARGGSGASLALALAVAGFWSSDAAANTDNWQVGSSDWNAPDNWSSGVVPGAGDTVNIGVGNTASFTVAYDYTGLAVTLSSLSVGVANTGGVATLSISADSLAANTEYVGGLFSGGHSDASINQTGGTNTISDGSAPFLFVGNNIGSTGTYTLSGTGSLSDSLGEIVGDIGVGIFNQSSGINTIGSDGLSLGYLSGSTGTYTLGGTGSLSVSGQEYVGGAMGSGAGVFNQSGGTNAMSALFLGFDSGSTGTYNLAGTGSLLAGSETVGYNGSGNFNQSSGRNTITGTLTIVGSTSARGMYSLYGGTLTAGAIVVNTGGIFTNSGAISLTGNNSTAPLSPTGGAYTQTSIGTLNIQINGSGNGQFGQLTAGQANLAGDLTATTPGSSGSPGFLPYNGTYQILSTSSSLSGTFNNDAGVQQTTFASDGKPSGVFDVSYTGDSVALSNFHQVHLLSYGISWPSVTGASNDPGLLGGVDASLVSEAFNAHVAGLVDNTVASLGSDTPNNENTLEAAISNMAATVHKGDLAIFYIGTHGTFNPSDTNQENAPIIRQTDSGSAPSTQAPAALALQISYGSSGQPDVVPSGEIDAPTFASLFSSPNWVGVNKLFIIDSCYAGGLWAGAQGPSYLSALDHSAIIAAAPDALESQYEGDSLPSPGQSLLSLALEQALSNLNGEPLTYNSLLAEVNLYYNMLIPPGSSGFSEDGLPTGGPQPLTNNVWGEATSDFNLDLGGITVPEPGRISLAVCACGALLARRPRRQKTQ